MIYLKRYCYLSQLVSETYKIVDCKNKISSVDKPIETDNELDFIKKKCPKLKPVLGRLINKRKKDPANDWKWGCADFKKYLEENNLNCKHFSDILRTYNVYRI